MPEFDEHTFERVKSACQDNADAIAQSLNLCFDCRYRVEVGDSRVWEAPGDEEAAGLLVAFQFGEQGLICLVPETLPMPDWYRSPDISQQARLQTLAMEWSLSMMPADMEADQYRSLTVENLEAAVVAAGPAESARMLELLVFHDPDDDDSTTDSQPTARIHLLGPVSNPPFGTTAEAETGPAQTETPAVSRSTTVASPAPSRSVPAGDERTALLASLPVTVSVRLAEKKIEMGTLLSLMPGTLITFDKSCEDLLDLFVNNELYCRGEAVKIDEKFGLKINEIGVEEVREERVMNL